MNVIINSRTYVFLPFFSFDFNSVATIAGKCWLETA